MVLRSRKSRATASLLGAAAFALAVAAPSAAEDGGGATIHGFVQWNATARTTGVAHATGDFPLGEARARLALEGTRDIFSYTLHLEAAHDAALDRDEATVHEAHVDLRSGAWDIRVGRQIATWGTGDLLFVNDLFPKDWEALFLGRPIEYLKRPFDAARIVYSTEAALGAFTVDLVATPFFTADRLPGSDRFIMADPFRGTPRVTRTEEREFDDVEAALRLRLEREGTEWALYGYRGRYRAAMERPDNWAAPTSVLSFHPRLAAYGASLTTSLGPGIAYLEAGRRVSLDDRAGTDFAIENSSIAGLVGYRWDPAEDFTVGFQYYIESREDDAEYRANTPAGWSPRRRIRDVATARLTRLMRFQTLRLDLFAAYSPADGDAWVMPEVRYQIRDGVWASLGATLFDGGAVTPFGMFDANDNLHMTIRYEF